MLDSVEIESQVQLLVAVMELVEQEQRKRIMVVM